MNVSLNRPPVRAAAILIEDNKILIVKQNVTETRQWALPGGKLEFGETIEQCMIREMKEETGLDIAVKELLYITDRLPHLHQSDQIVHIMLLVERIGGQLRSGKELEKETEKIKELAMVPVDHLPDYGFPPAFSELIKMNFPDRGSYKGDFQDFYGGW
jgi:mutator protein MutT